MYGIRWVHPSIESRSEVRCNHNDEHIADGKGITNEKFKMLEQIMNASVQFSLVQLAFRMNAVDSECSSKE